MIGTEDSASAAAAAPDTGHRNADDQGTSGVILFTLRYELDRAGAAHPKCCCASCIAGTLLNGCNWGLFVL